MFDGMDLKFFAAASVFLVLYLLRKRARHRREDALTMREYDL